MSERYVFIAYPAADSGWIIEYPLDPVGNFLDCRKETPALGIIELLPQVNTANGRFAYIQPHVVAKVYTFECEPNGAFIFTTLAIDGKVGYSTVDESAAYGRWELAQALLEDEVHDAML